MWPAGGEFDMLVVASLPSYKMATKSGNWANVSHFKPRCVPCAVLHSFIVTWKVAVSGVCWGSFPSVSACASDMLLRFHWSLHSEAAVKEVQVPGAGEHSAWPLPGNHHPAFLPMPPCRNHSCLPSPGSWRAGILWSLNVVVSGKYLPVPRLSDHPEMLRL